MNVNLAIIALVAALFATPGHAATLDFSGLSRYGHRTPQIELSNATLRSPHGFYVRAAGIDHEICAWTLEYGCENDLDIDFHATVSHLSFDILGWQLGDSLYVHLYGAEDQWLGSSDRIFGNGTVRLDRFRHISRITLDYVGFNAGGLAYDHFEFCADPPREVPLPGTLPLLLAGLAAIGLLQGTKG